MKSIESNIPVTLILGVNILLALLVSKSTAAEESNSYLKEKIVVVNGMKINYRVGGSGPVLLMLHGYTLTGKLWDPYAEELAEEYKLIIPDFPGHGKSDSFTGGPTFKKYADFTFDFLKEIGVERFHGVGHSLGGMTLLHMASQNSKMISSMILIGSGHKFTKESVEFTRQDTFENLSEAQKKFYRTLHPQGDQRIIELHEQLMPLMQSHAEFNLYDDKLREMKTKSLIILGDNDLYFDPEYATEMFRVLPNSQLWIIPGEGHLPINKAWGGSAEADLIFTKVFKKFVSLEE